ncbi:MAG: prefoldin subunit alpha [Methanophagales archaeon]|nr:prefoldin subunit alpha [Methanophagales archaeon]
MEESEKGLSGKEREQRAELQTLVLKLRQYQAHAEQVSQELLLVKQAINEHDKAIETIKQLKAMKTGDELIVPIGANSSIYVTLSSTDKIIVGIGGGISTEKSPDSSIEYLGRMKTNLETTQQEKSSLLQKIEQEAQKLQVRLQGLS